MNSSFWTAVASPSNVAATLWSLPPLINAKDAPSTGPSSRQARQIEVSDGGWSPTMVVRIAKNRSATPALTGPLSRSRMRDHVKVSRS